MLSAVAHAARQADTREAAFELLQTLSSTLSPGVAENSFLMEIITPLWRKISELLVRFIVAAQAEIIRTWLLSVCEPALPPEVQVATALAIVSFGSLSSQNAEAVTGNIPAIRVLRIAFSPDLMPLVLYTAPQILPVLEGLGLLQYSVLGCLGDSSGVVDLPRFGKAIRAVGKPYVDFVQFLVSQTRTGFPAETVVNSALSLSLEVLRKHEVLKRMPAEDPGVDASIAALDQVGSQLMLALAGTDPPATFLGCLTEVLSTSPRLGAQLLVRAMERSPAHLVPLLELLLSQASQGIYESSLLDPIFYPQLLSSIHQTCVSCISGEPDTITQIESVLLPRILSPLAIVSDFAVDMFCMIAATPVGEQASQASQQFFFRYVMCVKELARVVQDEWISVWESASRDQTLRKPIQHFLEKLIPCLPVPMQTAIYNDMINKGSIEWRLFAIDFLPCPTEAALDAISVPLEAWLRKDNELNKIMQRVVSSQDFTSDNALLFRVSPKLSGGSYSSITLKVLPPAAQVVCGRLCGRLGSQGFVGNFLQALAGGDSSPRIWLGLETFATAIIAVKLRLEASHIRALCAVHCFAARLPEAGRLIVANLLFEIGRDCRLPPEPALFNELALLLSELASESRSPELLAAVREAALAWLSNFHQLSLQEAGPLLGGDSSFLDHEELPENLTDAELEQAKHLFSSAKLLSSLDLIPHLSHAILGLDASVSSLNPEEAAELLASRELLSKLYKSLLEIKS